MHTDELIDAYLEQEKMYNFEGPRGVVRLDKLLSAIGYRQEFGADVIATFLADNSGAMEAIVNWIRETNVPEWNEQLRAQLRNGDNNESDD